MYAPDTILKLRSQREPDDETGEEFAYNRVRVIGPSPVNHAEKADAKYTGTDAAGVLLEGLSNFGATLDQPFGRLRELYEVESIPEKVVEVKPTIRVVESNVTDAGPTPEDVFKTEAPGVPPEEGQIRGRTPLDPLAELDTAADPHDPLAEPAPKPEAGPVVTDGVRVVTDATNAQ
jgi:hypothetical protein